jgi:hypothetical protein
MRLDCGAQEDIFIQPGLVHWILHWKITAKILYLCTMSKHKYHAVGTVATQRFMASAPQSAFPSFPSVHVLRP